MTYFEQLQTEEWKEKRKGILSRDKHTCQNCQNEKYMQYSGSPAKLEKTDNEYHYYKIDFSIPTIKVKSNCKLPRKVFMYYDSTKQSEESISIREYDFRNDNHLNSFLKDFNVRKGKFKVLYELILDGLYSKGYEVNKIKETAINIMAEKSNLSIDEMKYYLNTQDMYYKYPKNEFRDNFKWLYAKNLHIHHKYYQQSKKAWEYPDDALITLCWDCHEELHENEEIDVYDIYGNLIGTGTPCNRCHGAGYLPEYNHVENGICFKCNGARIENFVSKGI